MLIFKKNLHIYIYITPSIDVSDVISDVMLDVVLDLG